FTSSGTFLTKWGSHGTGNGEFSVPFYVTVDAIGSVYVADTGNYRIQKFTSDGTFLLTWGNRGTNPGQFLGPGGLAADGSGDIYVADTGSARIQKFSCP